MSSSCQQALTPQWVKPLVGHSCTPLRPMGMQTLGCRTMLQQTNLASKLAAVQHDQQL
jgi:hypothetical protein